MERARHMPGARTDRSYSMAIDTLMAFVGVYDSVDDAQADYQLVHELQPRRA
jgi:hypothetical protein